MSVCFPSRPSSCRVPRTERRSRRTEWLLLSGEWSALFLLLGFVFFYDVERKAMLQLHAGRTENGADGASRPTLLPDHFANIAGGDTKAQDGGGGFDDGLYGNLL